MESIWGTVPDWVGAIGQWVGAVATAAAVWVSVQTAREANQKLEELSGPKIEFFLMTSYEGYDFALTNTSNVPVTICSVFFQFPEMSHHYFPLFDEENHPDFPVKLKPGEFYRFKITHSKFREFVEEHQQFSEFLDDNKVSFANIMVLDLSGREHTHCFQVM